MERYFFQSFQIFLEFQVFREIPLLHSAHPRVSEAHPTNPSPLAIFILIAKNSLRWREKQSHFHGMVYVIACVGSPVAEFPMDSSDFSIVSPPFMTDDGSRRRSEDHPVGTAPRLPESFYTWASR